MEGRRCFQPKGRLQVPWDSSLKVVSACPACGFFEEVFSLKSTLQLLHPGGAVVYCTGEVSDTFPYLCMRETVTSGGVHPSPITTT